MTTISQTIFVNYQYNTFLAFEVSLSLIEGKIETQITSPPELVWMNVSPPEIEVLKDIVKAKAIDRIVFYR